MGFYCSAIIRRDQIWKDDGLLVTKKKKKRKSSLFWLTIDCGLFGWQHLNPNVASHEWSFDFRQQQLWEENAYSFVVDDDKMTRKCQQWLRVMVSMCHPWFSEKFAITNYQPTGRLNELEFFPCTVNCHVKLAYSCHYPSFYSLFANNFQSDFELGGIEQFWNWNDLKWFKSRIKSPLVICLSYVSLTLIGKSNACSLLTNQIIYHKNWWNHNLKLWFDINRFLVIWSYIV